MPRDDDDLIPWTEELPPCIEPGPFDAVVLSAKRVNQYRRWMVEFLFRLITMGTFFDVRLKGYCNLGQIKNAKLSPHSKFASWQRAVAAFTGGSPSRVTLRSFRGFWFTVMVSTVTHDGNQKLLAERDHYSAVTDIITVVGKLAELPPDRQLPPHSLDEERS